MKYIKCNLCGSDDYRLLFKTHEKMFNLPGEFSVVECKRCSLIYLNPQLEPDEINRYYPDEYDAYSKGRILEMAQRIIAKLDSKNFKKYIPNNAKILEIGCGSGEYLNGLRRDKWEVTGIDISEYAVSIAKKKYNLNVMMGDLLSMKFEEKSFDLVILRHVLEHLPDPDEELKEIRRILKDNGLIYLVIPNADTLERNVFKEYWFPYEVPRHLFLFSVRTITELLRRNKFKVLSLKHSIVPNNWILSLHLYLKEKNYQKISNFFTISNPLLLLLFTPVTIFLSILKTSGRIKILAEKK